MSHTVATYNMSFMSDKMDDLSKSEFASEWAWLNQLGSQVTTPGHRRDFWLNAMN